jgi:uncharacterized protein YjdB
MNKFLNAITLVMAMIFGSSAWAQCVLAPGASAATIQAAENTAGSGGCPTVTPSITDTGAPTHTVYFSAGAFPITAVITVPNGVWNVGPIVSNWSRTTQPTAILTETTPLNSWGFVYDSGSVAGGVKYLSWNGNHNDNNGSDGGGFFSLGNGTNAVSNFTFEFNQVYGNYGTVASGNTYDTLLYFQGSEAANGGGTDTGNTVAWNHFGVQGSSDCGPIMNLFTYQGSTYDSSGGQCAAIGSQISQTNLTISNNIITQMEQGMKFYEGCTSFPCAENSVYLLNNVNVFNNDFSFIHRIGMEGQQVPYGVGENIYNNDFHDSVSPSFGSWMFSLAQCCSSFSDGTGTAPMNFTGNVLLSNTNLNGQSGPGLEYWAQNAGANNNLNQGFAPLQYGCGAGTWEMNNNITAVSGSTSGGINDEGCNGTNIPLSQQTGNVSQGFPPTALVSAVPTISPSSGSFSGAHTVTFTDAGITSGVGPQGNHSIWYTLDGSSPVPGSGTSTCIASGGTASVTATSVNAVGMWGACNQPTSYPTGYGFVPSSVVKATFTSSGGGTTPTLSSIALSGTSAITVGGTSQLTATGTLSNGTIESVTPTAWTSSNTSIATVSSSGLVTAVSSGTATITGTFSGITSTAFTVTVSAAVSTAPAGYYLGTTPTANVNTLIVGQTLQFQTWAFFSNGAPDGVVTASSYVSSNTAVCTVNNTGLATAVSSGTCSIDATVSGVNSSSWTITVSAATPPVVTLSSIAVTASKTSVTIGGTSTLTAIGTMSNGTTETLTPTYTVSNADGTVSGSTFTGVSAGTVSITATSGSITSNSVSITVTAPVVTLTSMVLSPFDVNTTVGSQFTFSLTGTFSSSTTGPVTSATWTSSNTSVATVSNGVVTSVGVGSAVITATSGSLSTTALVSVFPVGTVVN